MLWCSAKVGWVGVSHFGRRKRKKFHFTALRRVWSLAFPCLSIFYCSMCIKCGVWASGPLIAILHVLHPHVVSCHFFPILKLSSRGHLLSFSRMLAGTVSAHNFNHYQVHKHHRPKPKTWLNWTLRTKVPAFAVRSMIPLPNPISLSTTTRQLNAPNPICCWG